MDHILREAMEMTEGGLQIEYITSGGLFLTYRDKTSLTTSIRDIQYADDLTVAAQHRPKQSCRRCLKFWRQHVESME